MMVTMHRLVDNGLAVAKEWVLRVLLPILIRFSCCSPIMCSLASINALFLPAGVNFIEWTRIGRKLVFSRGGNAWGWASTMGMSWLHQLMIGEDDWGFLRIDCPLLLVVCMHWCFCYVDQWDSDTLIWFPLFDRWFTALNFLIYLPGRWDRRHVEILVPCWFS